MLIQHISTACLIFEIDGVRFITDPVFDSPGKTYQFLPGFYSKKLEAPSLQVENLPPIQVCLLSHDHHADNLDKAGRKLLEQIPLLLTTEDGQKRLTKTLPKSVQCHGLKEWQIFELGEVAPDLEVVAVPSQHYQRPLFQFIVGQTLGFLIRRKSTGDCLYFSGDTVLFRKLEKLNQFKIKYAFLHLGGVKFPLTFGLRYTLSLKEAESLARIIEPQTIIPIHYKGWTHFKEHQTPNKNIWSADLSPKVMLLDRDKQYTLDF